MDFRPLRLYTPFSPLDPLHTVYEAPAELRRRQHLRFRFDRRGFPEDLAFDAFFVILRVTAILVSTPQNIPRTPERNARGSWGG